ncbi:tripartite tricarboxylate transporter TctB family protein [Halomonas campisalis]|uniref:Tripartite tricarboxylate transporter TctB family protein n=1 Tax=Billgrantia campisalis TaxID=74661 RepID=A0ABS9P9F4_9GAMM|nr:tripartite tricarboxylate transporter TctB family protein [Halomonas campisalis]MCG6658403.1 tripartite tricarboxylate transporter TctB family protein [Halomonas campisalis]MDR5863074.1 tripartite tricarboxylate transporter TctB family protein [Halomonas campisalis]
MERRTREESLLPTLQLLSYAIIASLALLMSLKAGSLPASRWEPMSAGAFPRIIFLSIAVLCTIAFVTELFKQGLPRTTWATCLQSIVKLKTVIVNLVLFIAYMAFLPWLGFMTSTFLYLSAAQILMAPKRLTAIVIALLVAAVFSAGPYYLFSEVFSIYLPRARW